MVSVLILVTYISAFSEYPSLDMFSLRALITGIGIVSGLILVIASHFLRAMLDSADYNGEMLAIMTANLTAINIAEG
jgi:hypothetical protein